MELRSTVVLTRDTPDNLKGCHGRPVDQLTRVQPNSVGNAATCARPTKLSLSFEQSEPCEIIWTLWFKAANNPLVYFCRRSPSDEPAFYPCSLRRRKFKIFFSGLVRAFALDSLGKFGKLNSGFVEIQWDVLTLRWSTWRFFVFRRQTERDLGHVCDARDLWNICDVADLRNISFARCNDIVIVNSILLIWVLGNLEI